jgi:hypothetical protein
MRTFTVILLISISLEFECYGEAISNLLSAIHPLRTKSVIQPNVLVLTSYIYLFTYTIKKNTVSICQLKALLNLS